MIFYSLQFVKFTIWAIVTESQATYRNNNIKKFKTHYSKSEFCKYRRKNKNHDYYYSVYTKFSAT